jgi:hypothetical protein
LIERHPGSLKKSITPWQFLPSCSASTSGGKSAMKINSLMGMLAIAGITAQAGQDGTAGRVAGEARMLVRDDHPVVDGVYVNGHGPYRFLVDTGTNVDLIDPHLAETIGLTPTFRSELASSMSVTIVPGADGIEVRLGLVRADEQKLLFGGLEAIRNRWPDIQGVLGQWFLSSFDYTVDLQGKRLEFGKQDRTGTRSRFRLINGRTAISTSLGALILDSGADRLVLFGVQPSVGSGLMSELRTVTRSQQIGMVFSKQLVIEGRKIWSGDAVAIPNRPEPEVDGLIPLSLFKTIYVCNSAGYIVFE